MNFRSFKRFFGGGSRQVRRPDRNAQRRRKASAPLYIETLEDRSLMSTLPVPSVTDRLDLDSFSSVGAANTVFGTQIVMDPVNPNTLVEVHALNGPSGFPQIVGNFSLDGGRTWASTSGIFMNSSIVDPSTFNVYPTITNTSVTFDRANRNTIYVVSTQHNAATNSGAIVFNKYVLDSNGFTLDTSLGNIPGFFSAGDHVLYRWFNGNNAVSNPAFNPFIAIDNNEPTYTDPVTGLVQTDTMATLVDDPFDPDPTRLIPKGIYVAFNTVNAHRLNNAIQQVSEIYVMASADGGHNWTTQQYVVENFANTGAHFIYANDPRITFSQGTPVDPNDPGAAPRIQGGTLNFLYTDSLNNTDANFTANIFLDQSLPDGGVADAYPVAAARFVDNTTRFVGDAFAGGGPNNGDTPVTTDLFLNVNFNPNAQGVLPFPAFGPIDVTTLSDLDVEINLRTPNTRHLNIVLTDPNGNSYDLVFNGVDNANNATNRGVADSNLGLGTIPGPNNARSPGGLFFDLDAPMPITDPLLAAPWVGHFRPEGFFDWDILYNDPISSLSGTWTLSITDVRNNGSNPPPQEMLGWGLHFSSKIDTNGFGFESQVATTSVRTGVNNVYPTTITAAPAPSGVPSGAVFAYDNTLGGFSPFQGRLYVAYTSGQREIPSIGQQARPDIGIRYSDDNGNTWSQEFTINDDFNDNFTEGNRAQFMPAISVDPVTGAVVVSYYDGRTDAAGTRVANSVAVSIDGGRSWSPSAFLNDLKTANDFLTGETHVLEPIPGNMGINGPQGFGDHQGIVAYNGRAIPTYATNFDVIEPNNVRTSRIRTAAVTYAAGPRIVSGDMGPLINDFNNPDNPNVFTYNNTFAPDGTRRLDGFVINFDRAVDPSTLTTGDVTVQYRNPDGTISLVPIGVQSITPLNLDQPHGAVDDGTQPTVTVGDALVIEGDSGITQAVFEVMLSRPQLSAVTVGFATRDATALAGQDYVARTGQVVFPVGQVRATFTVDVLGDLRNEGAESFLVDLTSLTPGVKRDDNIGRGRIVDDDGIPTISVGDAFIHEGNSGTKLMSFPVVLSIADPTGPVAVNFSTVAIPGSAVANVDYNTTSGTVVFNPGQTTALINVVIRGDVATEGTEDFQLVLANPVPQNLIALGRSQALGRIFDDDTIGAPPSVIISDAILKETDAGVVQATFTATLSAAQAGDVLIDYQTQDGTALAPQDYAAKTAQLVIPAGQTTATFTVNVNGDVRSEGVAQNFNVLFSAVTPGITLLRGSAVGRIIDDDTAPTITIGDPIIREGDSGFQFISFPVALSIPDFDNAVTFNYATFDDTAVGSTATQQGDYNPTSLPFTFAPGQTTGMIDIAVFGDIIVEPATERFGLQGSSAVGASFARSTAFGFILEDDNIGTPTTVSIGDAIVKEGNSGVVQATFKVVLSQKQPRDVVIGYVTRDGGATAGQDYDATANLLVIPAEQTEATFTIDVRGDTAKEGNETFFVDLMSVSPGVLGARTTGIGTIVDDDGAPAISLGDAMVREGDGGSQVVSFPIFLNVATTDQVAVDFALGAPFGAGGAALTVDFNYVNANRTFTFAPNQTAGVIDVVVFGDQVIERGNEIFFLDLSNARNASVARPRGVGTIVDDDTLGLTVGDVMVHEGDDTLVPAPPGLPPPHVVDVPVYLNAVTSQDVTFTWITEALSATADADYTEISNGTGTITAGTTSTMIQVPILYDLAPEALETFRVRITTSTNAARVDGEGIVTLVDNDELPDITIGDVTYREGTAPGRVSVPVYLSFPSATPVTVGFNITDGPAIPPNLAAATSGGANPDYTIPGATVTFAPGQSVAFIEVPIVNDAIAERTERFTVTLVNPPGNAEFSNKISGIVTVVDDDVTVSISDRAQFEGDNGATGFNFQLMLSSPRDTDVTVSLAARGGTATIVGDFTFTNGNYTVPAGQTVLNVPVSVVGETSIEPAEDFFIDITGVTTNNADIGKATGHGLIVDDDDTSTTTWTIGDVSIFEGNSGTRQMSFTIFASPAPGVGNTIRYTVPAPPPNPQGSAAPGQDYVPISALLTVASSTAVQFGVSIDIIGDQLQEPGFDDFFVLLSGATTGSIDPNFDLARGSIIDDDQQVMVFSDFSQREGNSGASIANVPVVLSNPGPTPQPFDFQLQDGTGAFIPAAVRPEDYFFIGPTNSTIPFGQTVQTLPVRLRGDLAEEGNEDFTLSLRNPLGNILVAKDTGTITIVDDDDLKVTVGDLAVQEGAGVANVRFFLNARSGQDVRVFYQTVPGSASDTPGIDDFATANNFVVIPAGSLSASVAIPITGDTIDEGNETFSVVITDVEGAGLDQKDTGIITIVDDDLRPELTLSPGMLREQNGTMAFTVYSSFPIAAPITMTVTTTNQLATHGADYNGYPLGTALTLPAMATSVSFESPPQAPITVIDDAASEGNEHFLVTLSNATQGATFAGPTNLGTIVDNEPTVAVNIGDLIVKENDSGTFTFLIPVILSGTFTQDITVFYRTVNDTATAPGDFVEITGAPSAVPPLNPLVIPAGSTSTTIAVQIHGDALKEGDHQFFVELFNSVGATIAKPRAVALIVDDDSALGATQYLVRITPQDRTGSYSYSISEDVRNRVQWLDYVNKPIVGLPPFITSNLMDQNNNSIRGENDPINAFANDKFAIPTPDLQVPFQGPYDPNTLPLIIPGPHLVANGFLTTTLSASPNTPIPSVGSGGSGNFVNDTGIGKLTAAGLTGQVADVNVKVNIDYPDSGHLNLRLRSPEGKVILLSGQNGNTNAYRNTTFDDQAGSSVTSGNGPYVGDVRPEEGLNAYNYLDAAKVNGEWSLEVEDRGVGFVGRIFDWSMTFTMTNAPSFNGNLFSKQANEAVPDLSNPVTNPAGTVFSNLQVSGLTGWITDVNVRVQLDYPDSGRLDLVLHAPNGRTISLANNNGDGNFFLGSIFDDQAANDINVQDPHGPFYHVHPNGNLSLLNGIKSELLNGSWQLEVRGATVGTNGILKGWGLDINTSLFNDNRILNGGTDHVDVVFDRDMNGNSFTQRDVLRLVTPAGAINQYIVSPDAVIPDRVGATPGQVASQIVVNDPGQIKDLSVLINITHARVGDLTALLIAPDGTQVQLFNNIGGNGANFTNTLLSDKASTAISSVSAPFTGTFRPTPGALSTLTGKNYRGTWTLVIRDTAAGVSGVLNSWGLIPFTVTPLPGAPSSMANRAFRIGFANQILSGSYQVTVGSDIASSAGHQIDTNLNVGVDIIQGGDPSTGPLTAKTYKNPNSTTASSPPSTPGLNIPIPANTTIEATILITDQFKITQGPAADAAAHIQVFTDIAHSQDPDLAAVLIAPDGEEIRLFTNVNVSSRVTFDDYSASGATVTGGSTFDLGTFKPQIPLGRLQGKFTSGLWTLRLTNNGFTPGTLKGFNLRFPYFASGSGLGEPIADQFTTGFRIFTMDAGNPLSDSVWTAVGPAASNQYGSAGRVTAIAVDPSDPSGNTVYVGSANGGVWKTTNFLTTNPQGPTYVPLTDLGPSNSLNINHITILPRNNDPRQSIIFVATGDTDTNAPGIGLLRSVDGGATWQVIDGLQNFDINANPLPLSSTSRDHAFVGTRVNKIFVDPTSLPNTNGEYAVYIAVGGGGAQGLYRSLTTGKSWSLIRAGNATDVVLAPASGSTNGVLQLMYAAFEDEGTFFTTSATSTSALFPMAGGVGKPNHIDPVYGSPIPVVAPTSTPNGNNRGRILLATPHKTGDLLADTFLQNWVIALVIDSTGLLFDLYVTKDRGDNWTRVIIPVSGDFNTPAQGFGLPTNDENITASSSIRNLYPSVPSLGGDFSVALTIDPNNPNIIYLAGDRILKVDITTLADPWAVVHGDHSDNVAGAAAGVTDGPIAPAGFMRDNGSPQTPGGLSDPNSQTDFFNMYRDPFNPFFTPSTFTYNTSSPPAPRTTWTNTGTDIRWSYFDQINDVFSQSNSPPFRAHELLAIRDPLTGKTRILLGNDQGVYTAVDRGDGSLHTGIGSADSVRGSRNGNLQIAQMLAGAVQPSTLAADVAGSLFYAMALNNGTQASAADVINTGNLNWQTYDQTGNNDLIATAVDGNGSWIVTDATGGFDRIDDNGSVIFDPNRIGTTYQYRWPCCINQDNLGVNDFFIIDFPNQTPISRGTNLPQSTWPFSSPSLFTNGTPRPFGRFAVNPLSPDAMVISAQSGRVYRSAGPLDGYGIFWTPIAEPGVLDGTSAQAMAFGSPATTAFNLNDFIYAGTDGGRMFVTQDGGGNWRNITANLTTLDGTSILSVIPNPRRGSNEVYIVTGRGVYWVPDSNAPTVTWTKLNDIGGRDSLFNFNRPVFNNPNDLQPIMQAGQITSMAIDWRYQIPDNLSNPDGPKHPVLYVAGNAGVFRSIDKGITWNLYPDLNNNQAPQEGGYLPNVYVTDLDIMLGYLNPETGTTNHAASHNILMASTYGRGAFAIRLDDAGFSQFLVDFTKGPRVIDVKQVSPNPGDVLTGFDVVFNSLVDGITFTTDDVKVLNPSGEEITILSVREISEVPPGGLNPHNVFRIEFAPKSQSGNYRIIIGPNLSDFGGNLMNQDNDNINGENPADKFDFLFFFQPNQAPTISDILDQSIEPNQSVTIPFLLEDDKGANQLTLSATVDNPALIVSITFDGNPNPSIAGSKNPTITVTGGPTIGVATITVTVTDQFALFDSDTFQVFLNNPPTLLPDPLPNFSGLHGEFPRLNHVDLSGTDPDGDTVTFGGNAYANSNFTNELNGYVTVNAATGQVDLTPASSFVGTYYVRVFSTDGKAKTFGSFTVQVINNAPSLAPIGDIVAHHRDFPMVVTLNGSDPDPGENLSYSAKAYDLATYNVRQLAESLRLIPLRANFSFNRYKRKEKHFFSLTTGFRYFILPNGQLFRFTGTPKKLRGVFVTQVSSLYWAVPSLLVNPPPATELPGLVSVSGNQVTLKPGSFIGTFVVEATVTDGAASATRAYKVTSFNNPPRFNSTIGSVTADRSQFPQSRTLDAGDPDGNDAPLLSYSATAFEAESYRLRQLDNQYGLFSNGNYMRNKYKRNEKHIRGIGNKNFFITPNGFLFQRTNPANATTLRGRFIAALSPSVWLDPSQLWNSKDPTVLTGFVNLSGTQINFTPDNNFVGTYFVDARVSDGVASATQSIQVNVQ